MKRKSLLTLSGVICLALIIAVMPFVGACAPKEAPAPAPPVPTPVEGWQEQEPDFYWKAQTAWPKGCGLDYLQRRSLDIIEHWTHGRVKFECYSSDEIVPGYEIFEAVEKGVVPVGLSCPCYSMKRIYVAGMWCSSPHINSVQKMALYHGTPDVKTTKDYRMPAWELLERLEAKYYGGIHIIPSALQTTETFLYSMKPINTIADLQALKMRSAGHRGDVMKRCGCDVIGIPAGEVLPAMERGVIDACEFANFFGDVDLGFADVAKYIYFTPLRSQPSNTIIMFNKDAWAEVPDDLKAQIEEGGFEAMKWSLAESLFLDFLYFKKAEEEHGAKIALLPEDVAQFVWDCAMEVYDEIRQEDPEFDEYLKLWEEFEKEYGKYYEFIPPLIR